MVDLLPETVTLADLVAEGRLSKPPRYLRMALANLLFAGEYGSVVLRIGRMGNGTWPMYVLEQNGKIIDRFDGQTHKSWINQGVHHDENWSEARTTAAELLALWQKVTPNA
ncbi:MAG TPA: hypothetical protein VFB31_11260 [Pseudolabrys sp.]|jgi:hypothetical protein|nr:hypothetical protein [Pseudolabrys sp.]